MWNNLWSVSRYVMWPLSGPRRQSGNDQQCLAAPIWKYRSGFGDHRFTFFKDLRPNYTFYTNLTNIAHWVVAYRDVAHMVRLNLGKSWEKSAKSFDAGLRGILPFSCNNYFVEGTTWYMSLRGCWQCNDILIAILLSLNPLGMYRQFSNIRCTQSQNINVSRLVLQLSLPNPLKPGVKVRMKMWLEQHRQAMLQLHLSDQQFYCLLRCFLY